MPKFEIYSIVIIAAAIVVKIAIGLFFMYKAKKTQSEALDVSGYFKCFKNLQAIFRITLIQLPAKIKKSLG